MKEVNKREARDFVTFSEKWNPLVRSLVVLSTFNERGLQVNTSK